MKFSILFHQLKNELKKEIKNGIKNLKGEMISSFKKCNAFLFHILFGIQNNINVSKFIKGEFSYVHNKPYSYLKLVKLKIMTTNLCFGGLDSTNNVLLDVSCGLCSIVFKETVADCAYWYFTRSVTYIQNTGFVANSAIRQEHPGTSDLSNNQRVSWRLNIVEWGGGEHKLGSLMIIQVIIK
jgi:hypothetical protein